MIFWCLAEISDLDTEFFYRIVLGPRVSSLIQAVFKSTTQNLYLEQIRHFRGTDLDPGLMYSPLSDYSPLVVGKISESKKLKT